MGGLEANNSAAFGLEAELYLHRVFLGLNLPPLNDVLCPKLNSRLPS
jgi:hypothetical protein